MHAVAVSWRRWRSARGAAIAIAIAILIVPVPVTSIVHALRDPRLDARHRCDDLVIELNHDLASRADRAARGGGSGDHVTATIGNWARSDEAPAYAHAYTAVFVNGVRALAINDRAVLPQSVLTDLGYPSTVEWRCSRYYDGPHTDLVKRIVQQIDMSEVNAERHDPTTLTIIPAT